MSFYENLVLQTQMNYSRHRNVYASKKTPVKLSQREPLPYDEQIHEFVRRVREAECIVVGGASGLSAAGGGDFYYGDTPSFRKYFGKYAEKYGFKGAFDGMYSGFDSREEHWGYIATFLNTTLNAPVREPYLDLDEILKAKDFHILTTNQDTQFIKIYKEEQVSEIQGDHRFFQCSQCCHDGTWDAVKPVEEMVSVMGEGTSIPTELIPRCPKCGAEAFPWVRGYGNFLQGKKYDEQYQKISKYIQKNADKKILFLELGVGRLTPMFIQEPFWNPESICSFSLQETPKKDSEIVESSPESASTGMNLREIWIHEDAISEILWQRWIACYMLYDWNFHHAETSYCNNKCMWTDRVYNRLEGTAIEEDESLEELMTDTFNQILAEDVEDFIQTHMRVWKCDRTRVELQVAKAMTWIF